MRAKPQIVAEILPTALAPVTLYIRLSSSFERTHATKPQRRRTTKTIFPHPKDIDSSLMVPARIGGLCPGPARQVPSQNLQA